ncbi:MAG: outer membrane protein [Methylovirgula sp.]
MTRFTGSMQALLAAGALVVGTAGVAAAADLPLPPPPVMEPIAPPPFSGWYLRGDVGVGLNQSSNFISSAASTVSGFRYNGYGIGTQAIFGLGVGYQFNNWFRADVTGEYRTDSKYWANEGYAAGVGYGAGSDGYFGAVRNAVFLANGYVDLGTWYGFTPFVGAGVGVADTNFHGLMDVGLGPSNYGGFGTASDRTSAQLAWALMAGVDYAIAPNWRVELSYRYLDMGSVRSNGIMCLPTCAPPYETQSFHMASNDIRVGLRYIFAEIPPMAPPLQGPVISKY